MDYLLRCIADHGRRGELGITDLDYSPGSVPQYLPDLGPILNSLQCSFFTFKPVLLN